MVATFVVTVFLCRKGVFGAIRFLSLVMAFLNGTVLVDRLLGTALILIGTHLSVLSNWAAVYHLRVAFSNWAAFHYLYISAAAKSFSFMMTLPSLLLLPLGYDLLWSSFRMHL